MTSHLPELRTSFHLQSNRDELVRIDPANESDTQDLIRIFHEGHKQKQRHKDTAWDGRDFSREVPNWIANLSVVRLEKLVVGAFILSDVDAVWDKFIAQVQSSQPELLAEKAISLGKFAMSESVRGTGLGGAVIESGIVPYAIDNRFDCIRLDYPKSENSNHLRKYYSEHHFTPRGTIEVPLGGTNNPDGKTIIMELAQRDLDVHL